jgi:hypothetical protein
MTNANELNFQDLDRVSGGNLSVPGAPPPGPPPSDLHVLFRRAEGEMLRNPFKYNDLRYLF